ncbi:hypothetical protein BDZ94DRAFT_851050 [Collybia nuda]|uniref:Uncharacterized protein n=1 Tax=Collybia nuda TaxID=64659 RepID=A0A9P5YFY6_9AGAR|nr:hypothetical protein BDZ94DRAFT_851050 [Collybia nuda]
MVFIRGVYISTSLERAQSALRNPRPWLGFTVPSMSSGWIFRDLDCTGWNPSTRSRGPPAFLRLVLLAPMFFFFHFEGKLPQLRHLFLSRQECHRPLPNSTLSQLPWSLISFVGSSAVLIIHPGTYDTR